MSFDLAISKLREAVAHATKHERQFITLGLTHAQSIIDAADRKAAQKETKNG